MTASRRYVPVGLACLLTLSLGSLAFAAGGSAGSSLDPYSYVPAPTSLKGSTKSEKGKKNHNIPLMKKTQVEEKTSALDDSTQSQTYVKMPGKQGKRQKETALEPDVKPHPKKIKVAPPLTTTKVSDIAPAPKELKKEKSPVAVSSKPVATGSGDDSVMGGIKTIGEGYSKTFKAASHGVVSSTKAASDAVLSGSKKMGTGIKNGAKASGDVFKKGANMVGLGFKATGDKIKEGAAPIAKIAKAPEKKAKVEKPKADKPGKIEVAKDVEIAKDKNKEKEKGHGFGAKLAHLPKPKMPKIGIPFVGGKKKAPVVDPKAGASETGLGADPDTNVAATPKQTPVAPKQTPIVDDSIQTAQAAPKVKPIKAEKAPKAEKAEKIAKHKGPAQGLAAIPGNSLKKIGKLWPFGHKDAAVAPVNDVAGKQTQAPM